MESQSEKSETAAPKTVSNSNILKKFYGKNTRKILGELKHAIVAIVTFANK